MRASSSRCTPRALFGLRSLLLVGVAALLLAGCGSSWDREDAPPPGGPTPPPEWVELGEHPEYQPPRYLVALGSSNVSPRQAHDRAQTQLRRLLRDEVSEAVADLLGTPKEAVAVATTTTSSEANPSDTQAPVDESEWAQRLDPVGGVTELLLATLVPSEADKRLRERVPLTRSAAIEPVRLAYYSDGFTFYALWGVDREVLAERAHAIPGGLASVVDAEDPEQVAHLVAKAAAEVAARVGRATQQQPAPALLALIELWAEAALITASVSLDVAGTVRLRRLDPRTVEVTLELHTLDVVAAKAGIAPDARFLAEHVEAHHSLDDAPLTLYALGQGCPATVRITDYGPSLASKLPVHQLDRDTPEPRATLGHHVSKATEGLALTPPTAPREIHLQLTLEVQPALEDSGTLWVIAERLPEGFAPWRHLFPVAVHRLDYVLPRLERLVWRSEVTAVLDGVEMERESLAPLMSALLIEAGHEALAGREQPEDEPLAPDRFLVTLSGHIEVQFDEDSERPHATGELRLVAEEIRDPDVEGRTDVELAVIELFGRGYPGNPGPFPALRDALSRSRVQTGLRQALDRFTR